MAGAQRSGCLGLFLAPFLGGKGEAAVVYPYGKRDAFLSPAEVSFFHVVKSILPPDYHLVTKVRLLDLFFVRQPHQNQAARNRIDRKHVDFVICDAKTMDPVMAIELDDQTHRRKDRQERDQFVDEVFRVAGIPLIHIPAAKGYQVDEIRRLLREAWKEVNSIK
ncbi:MAG: DUF2726 domain-containing protein [Verrucomicrobiae bacterium]|nr:DUF2726 domain-containing protein [Verrucomicrobiae bacterium]